jgi:amino acid transporter
MPELFFRIHDRYKTPTFSLLAVAAATLAVSLAWTFLSALTISVIIRITVYMIVCISLLRLRKTRAAQTDYYRVSFGPLLAIAGICLSLWLLSHASGKEVRSALILVAVGIAVFWIYRRFNKAD